MPARQPPLERRQLPQEHCTRAPYLSLAHIYPTLLHTYQLDQVTLAPLRLTQLREAVPVLRTDRAAGQEHQEASAQEDMAQVELQGQHLVVQENQSIVHQELAERLHLSSPVVPFVVTPLQSLDPQAQRRQLSQAGQLEATLQAAPARSLLVLALRRALPYFLPERSHIQQVVQARSLWALAPTLVHLSRLPERNPIPQEAVARNLLAPALQPVLPSFLPGRNPIPQAVAALSL